MAAQPIGPGNEDLIECCRLAASRFPGDQWVVLVSFFWEATIKSL